LAIVQDILLKFNADTSDIKKNVVDLASGLNQSIMPPAEGGALDAQQTGAVDEAIQQRAQALGLTYQEVRDVLVEMNTIAKEISQVEAKNQELAGQRVDLDKRSAEQTRLKNEKLKEAARLGGLSAQASQEEIVARRDELAELVKKGQATKEDKKNLEAMNHLIRSAAGHQSQVTKNANAKLKITQEEQANQVKINQLLDRYATKGSGITLTEEEREDIAARLVALQMKSTVETAKQDKLVTKTKEELEKATVEQDKLNKASAKTKDNFAQKAISALAYYEALNLLKRAARAAAQTLKELDAALTDIAVVTNMNREES
jgi:hypothetical protein